MGRRFNPNELTAAHRSLQLGTWVRVTELSSGRSVVVQITDRGPYKYRRGIDLSYEAARQLGMVKRGVARVLIELAAAPGRERNAAAARDTKVARADAGRTQRGAVRGGGTIAAASTEAWMTNPTVGWDTRTAGESKSGRRSETRS